MYNLDSMILKNLPLPPSANALYKTIRRGNKMFRAKSAEYGEYHSEMKLWCLKHGPLLEVARNWALQIGPKRFIKIDVLFRFREGRILCKDMTPKRNDTSNRIKALHDLLAEAMGLDDKWFWSGSFDKTWTASPAFPEGCDVTLTILEL